MTTNEQAPQDQGAESQLKEHVAGMKAKAEQQGTALQRLQAMISDIQADMAAMMKEVVQVQASNIVTENEIADLQADIAIQRNKLLEMRIRIMLRGIEI